LQQTLAAINDSSAPPYGNHSGGCPKGYTRAEDVWLADANTYPYKVTSYLCYNPNPTLKQCRIELKPGELWSIIQRN